MPVLDWIGKAAVVDHVRHVPFRLLDVDPALSTDPESPNLIVEGDNLHALRALLPTYAGRVRCIYIDPPYNTGNEGWAYNDAVNGPEMRAWLGQTVGKEAEDLSRHDKWLCMMYPRLVLLRELLADDGSIWISLDDNEAHHMRMLLDEVFGARNFVATAIWQKAYSPKNSAMFFSEDHDYILVYAKNKNEWRPELLERSEEALGRYENVDHDPRGVWKSGDISARNHYSLGTYPITTPSGRVIPGPPGGNYWRFSEKRLKALDLDNRIWWGDKGDGVPRVKRFLTEVKNGVVPQTLWFYIDVGHSQEAKQELNGLMSYDSSDEVFVTPKPVRLIERILQIATGPDDIVLDAFAGSGTTAHAVLSQNARDGGNRRFVLVEMEPAVAGPVTAERVRRAAEGYAFRGTARTELLRVKLTVTALRKMGETLAQAASLREARAADFDRFEEKVDKGAFVLWGVSDVAERKAGLGGGFRFARLGAPLMDADGQLSAAATPEAVARLAYFSVAREALAGAPGSPLVGVTEGRAVYVLGSAGGDGAPSGGTLTRRALAALPPHDGGRIVFGTSSRIDDAELAAAGVEFRQVPYRLLS